MSADVRELFPDADRLEHEAPYRTKEKDGRCRHYQDRYELDEDSRRAFCRDCGEEVEAFTVLLRLCREPERYMRHLRAVKRELRAREQSLEELRREERNAKARVRRARAVDGLV